MKVSFFLVPSYAQNKYTAQVEEEEEKRESKYLPIMAAAAVVVFFFFCGSHLPPRKYDCGRVNFHPGDTENLAALFGPTKSPHSRWITMTRLIYSGDKLSLI